MKTESVDEGVKQPIQYNTIFIHNLFTRQRSYIDIYIMHKIQNKMVIAVLATNIVKQKIIQFSTKIK